MKRSKPTTSPSTIATVAALLTVLVIVTSLSAAAQQKTLDIYFIDVEGGQATLFVTPRHESLLIDTGWAKHDSRDAKRIVAAAKLAGLSKIDYAIVTHYHADHTANANDFAGATWLVQQDWLEQVLKLYECQDATRLWSGSVGS